MNQKLKKLEAPIIIGCWQLSSGHSGYFNQTAIFNQLARYHDEGFTVFDCGDIYTGVEEALGSFRLHSGRKFQVNTKFVPDLNSLPTLKTDQIDKVIERSMSRLCVDKLDLVQFHWWDFNIHGYIEAALHLVKLQEAGKISAIGVTNFGTAHLAELIEAGVPVVSNQVQYSLIDGRPRKTLTEYAEKKSLELLCYGTLAGGLLSDKWLGVMAENFVAETRSHTKYHLIIEDIGGWEVFQTLLRSVRAIADKYQTNIATIASAYVLQQPNCRAIIGFSYQNHIDSLKDAISIKLDEEDITQLELLTKNLTQPAGDVYELERDRAGKHGRIMKYNLNNI